MNEFRPEITLFENSGDPLTKRIAHVARKCTASTIEAVKFELRTYGIAQLQKPHTRTRVAQLSSDQMTDVIASLRRMQPEYPQITDELIQLLQQVPE